MQIPLIKGIATLLIPSALDPGQKPLDRPVIGGSCVSVADRDRKKLEELFAG